MSLGGALGLAWAPVTPRHFAWQAWHNLTSTYVSRGRRATNSHPPSFCVAGVGRRGTDGIGWRAWTGLGACDAAALCVAGMAQPHIYSRFTWQAWHKLTSTIVLRGRRGTDGAEWRAWTGLGACDAAALCVAGVAQTHIHLRFTWQAWHKLTSTVVLRGRRGTHGTGWRAWTGLGACDAAALCVAGVAQPHIYRRFAWQAWQQLVSQVKWVICMQRGMFRLSVCFGMFDFGMFQHFLLSAQLRTGSVQTVAAICMSLAVSALSMDSCFVAIST